MPPHTRCNNILPRKLRSLILSDDKDRKAIDVPIPETGGTDSDMVSSIDLENERRTFNFFHRFLDGWINSAIAITTLSLVCFVLVLSNLYTIGLLETKFSQEKVVLVPSGLEKRIAMRTGEMSPEYLRQTGIVIASLYASFTPHSIKANIEALLDYATPPFYAKASKQLRYDADIASKSELTQSFVIRDFSYKKNTVFIKGIIRRYSFGKLVDTKESAIIILKIKYNAATQSAALDSLELHNDYLKWIKEIKNPKTTGDLK